MQHTVEVDRTVPYGQVLIPLSIVIMYVHIHHTIPQQTLHILVLGHRIGMTYVIAYREVRSIHDLMELLRRTAEEHR